MNIINCTDEQINRGWCMVERGARPSSQCRGLLSVMFAVLVVSCVKASTSAQVGGSEQTGRIRPVLKWQVLEEKKKKKLPKHMRVPERRHGGSGEGCICMRWSREGATQQQQKEEDVKQQHSRKSQASVPSLNEARGCWRVIFSVSSSQLSGRDSSMMSRAPVNKLQC